MYLAVYCAHLQLQRRRLQEPAVLVVKEHVVQVNAAAQRLGVRLGMGLASAAALCATLQVYPYELELERQLLQELAAHCYQVCGDIILAGSDCLIVVATSMRALYPSTEQLFGALAPVIRAFVPHFYYASGESMEAAELLAREQQNFISDEASVCRQHLARVEVTDLLLAVEHKQQLARLGIERVEQLLALPMNQLRQRFHYEVVDYLTRLQGQLPHAGLAKKSGYYRFYQPTQSFSESRELNFEIDNSERLLQPLTQLCECLCRYLRQHQLHTQRLIFSLFFREQVALELCLDSVEPQGQLAPWQALLEIKLAALVLPAPVIAIRLQCEEFVSADGHSENLFAKRQQGLAKQQLLSLLNARLGPQHCYRLQPGRAHIPEFTQVQEATLHPYQDGLPASPQALLRPNFMIEPTPLQEQLCLLRGPERIQSHWWQQAQLERDYYIGENSRGQLCWVFRDKHKGWFIQGYFA
ncbi:Y-family DNA polymerase [Pseudoalteromonas sp. T1lg76]|uniref:Y-family DNA polymerase n=1 Tax=Pseudoalteromonas sp. T1lg76 TaxID=2077103 RepID=UPI000CF6B272|nr:DNA polymerase Y family protein [Pseudoalteromonas sp. T1lg76]